MTAEELEKERKNKRFAMITSLSIHGALLLLFIFLLAWRAPVPPIPEYGIELALGFDDFGSGDSRNTTPVRTASQETPTAREGNPPAAEVPKVESARPSTEASQSPKTEVSPPKPVVTESKAETIRTETPPVVQEEASVKVEEKASVTKTEAVVERKVEEVKKVEEKVSPPKEEVKEVIKAEAPPAEVKKETVNEAAVMRPPTEKVGEGGNTTTRGSTESNRGDDRNEVGTKGREGGTIDARSLYGAQGGGGGGTSLNMSGWQWDFLPKPKDDTSESGKIVFEIRIDDRGEIISIRTLEKSVSPAVEKIYRQEVEKLTFSKTSDNTRPAPVSTGTITFILRAR
jgi:outer membrane biosynthesis protein TonB